MIKNNLVLYISSFLCWYLPILMSEDSVLAYKTNNKLYQNTCISKICSTYFITMHRNIQNLIWVSIKRENAKVDYFFPSIYDTHTIDSGVLTYSGGWWGDVLSEEIFEVAFIQYNTVATCV